MFYPQLNTLQKQLLDQVLTKILCISTETQTVFHLTPEERFKSSRNTYPFFPELDLLVILPTDVMADYFYERWMVALVADRKRYKGGISRVNLQVISESEFIDELDHLEVFKERVIRSRIVYDREAHLYN